MQELVGQFYQLCKDQFGCRYLQKEIEGSPQMVIDLVLAEIFESFAELMTGTQTN